MLSLRSIYDSCITLYDTLKFACGCVSIVGPTSELHTSKNSRQWRWNLRCYLYSVWYWYLHGWRKVRRSECTISTISCYNQSNWWCQQSQNSR